MINLETCKRHEFKIEYDNLKAEIRSLKYKLKQLDKQPKELGRESYMPNPMKDRNEELDELRAKNESVDIRDRLKL